MAFYGLRDQFQKTTQIGHMTHACRLRAYRGRPRGTDPPMTESPYVSAPRITVLPVQPGNPPFRIVEIDGEVIRGAET